MKKAERIVFLDFDTMADAHGELAPDGFIPLAKTVDVFGLTAPAETAERIGDADVVICNKVLLTREVLERCPNIGYIGILATGFNNVDIDAARERNIPVCNAGSYSTDAVAQLVFSYILDYYERIVLYANSVRLGEWEKSRTFSYFPYPTYELRGKRLAVIGYGHIGRRVAEIADVFGMEVLVATRTAPKNCKYPLVSIDEAFAAGDVVTLHCPLTDATAHMVTRERLCSMREKSVLINTARGGLVDEAALAWALNADRIGGAYVDVLDKEPMQPDTPLKGAKNCLITPHIGWVPQETRQRLLQITEDNLRGWLCGNPKNVVNGVTPEN